MELEEIGVAVSVVVLSAVSIYCKRNYFNTNYYRFFKPLPLVALLLHCAYMRVCIDHLWSLFVVYVCVRVCGVCVAFACQCFLGFCASVIYVMHTSF